MDTVIQRDRGVTLTPVISRAILVYNRGRTQHLADGIVVTPSHNPPEDGGFKYNPPDGGPADTEATQWIAERANRLLRDGNAEVKQMPSAKAIASAHTHEDDFVLPYGRDENLKLGQRALSQRARCNGAASRGAYAETMEATAVGAGSSADHRGLQDD